MKETLVLVEDLNEGEPFKKPTGVYVYLKMSENAMKHLGVDTSENVYGCGFHGKVTTIKKGTKVKPVSLRDAHGNLVDWEAWEERMGCDTRSIK